MPNPDPPRPLLDVSFNGQSIARVERSGQPLPLELTPTVQPTDPDPRLVFTDTNGTERIYDFASTRTSNVAALSIRVERGYVVQPDCLLGNPDAASVEDLCAGRADGLRLQPFFLPESNFDARTLAGRGLFARGLHYPGQVTPGNVSLLCICDGCARSFRVQSFHAGSSQLIYFYCARGCHTLAVSAMTPGASALLAPPDAESLRAFESRLPSCAACGGSFGYWNPFRCPHCERPYIDFEKHPAERPREYYGNHIYGEALQRWGDGV